MNSESTLFRSPVRSVGHALFILLILGFLAPDLLAQTPQYYYGTTNSGSNSYPFNTNSSRKCEFRYGAGEITNAVSGLISKVYFKRGNVGNATTLTNLTITMAQSPLAFTGANWPGTSTFWTTNTTQVYYAATGSIPAGSAGTWFEFQLTTPFFYDPTQTLIVQVCHDNYSGGTTVYYQTASYPPARRIYGGTNCAATSGTGSDGSGYHFGIDVAPAYLNDAGISSLIAPLQFCSGAQDIIVQLKNFGQNALTSATVNWIYDGVPQSTIPWSGNLASQGTVNVTLGNRTFAPGTLHQLVAYTTLPNGQSDSGATNDTLRSIVSPGLAGTYTIGGASPDFPTFTAAKNALVSFGVCGPVTFNVAAGTYTESVEFPATISGVSAVNTVTFDGGPGNAATRIITNAAAATGGFTIGLNGADYLRFRNLSIRQTGVTYGHGVALWNGANYNEVTNCIISTSTTSTNTYCSGVWMGLPTSTATGLHANYTIIANNTITGGYYGVYIQGVTSAPATPASNPIGNKVLGNTITEFYYYGIYAYYQSSPQYIGNTITQRNATSVTFGYGIYAYYNQHGPQFIKNNIIAGAYGMYVYFNNSSTTYASARIKIINNMMNVSALSYQNIGLYLYSCYQADVWYNTINLRNNSTSYSVYGLYLYGTSSLMQYNVRNNISAHTGTGASSVYLMYVSSTVPFQAFNYNQFWTTASNSTQFYYAGTYSWATLPKVTHNANSVWGNPYFVSKVNNLHSRSLVGYLTAQPIPEVIDDIDGQPRLPTPCIGADEYPTPPPVKDIKPLVAHMHATQDRWSRNVTLNHAIHAYIENVGLEDDPPIVRLVYKAGSMPATDIDGVYQDFSPPWDGIHQAAVTFSTPFVPPATGATTIYVRAFYPGDGNGANDGIAAGTQNVQTMKFYGFEDFNNFAAPTFSPGAPHPNESWTVVNTNGGAAWQTGAGLGVGGSVALQYPGDNQQADDWVFTPAALLEIGSSYRVQLRYRSVSGAPQLFDLAYGTAPNAASMTVFESYTATSASFVSAVGSIASFPFFNTDPATQYSYYLGIRVRSAANAGALVIEDLTMDDNPVPPPKIGIGLPGTPDGMHQWLPTPPIEFSAVYKKPGILSRTYEVVNATYNYGENGIGDFFWTASTQDPWIKLVLDSPNPPVYLSSNPFNPPRPMQGQTFTLSIDPTQFAPGTYVGELALRARLYNSTYTSGVDASNQVLRIPVKIVITDVGSVGGNGSVTVCHAGLTPGGSPYVFQDNVGAIFASVTVTSGSIPNMCIEVFGDQLPAGIGRYRYVKRYWKVYTGGDVWTADIDWHYTDNELLAGGVMQPDLLRCIRKEEFTGIWEDPTLGVTSQSFPTDRFVRGSGYTPAAMGGEHCVVTDYFGGAIPKNASGTAPAAFALGQNYPNPFHPSTSIDFAVPVDSRVKVSVFNSLGMEVAVLVDEDLTPGVYVAPFEATDLPSGSYVYRMTAGGFTQTRQMILAK